MLQGRPLDSPGGVQILLGLLGRDDDFLQSQGLFREDDFQPFDGTGHLECAHIGRITQAFRLHPVGAGFYGIQDESPLRVGHGPQVVFVQMHDGAGQGSAGAVGHPAADAMSGSQGLQSHDSKQQYA